MAEVIVPVALPEGLIIPLFDNTDPVMVNVSPPSAKVPEVMVNPPVMLGKVVEGALSVNVPADLLTTTWFKLVIVPL